jgi:hypothetical protein
VSLRVQQQIRGFDVSVEDVLLVRMIERLEHVSDPALRLNDGRTSDVEDGVD